MSYVIKRILLGIPTLFAMFTAIFVIIRVVPGDAAAVILGDHATPAALEALRTELGLDRPLLQQYLEFLGGLLQGDLGTSLVTRRPVLQEALLVLPNTLELAFASIIVGLALGIPLGVYAAINRNSWPDYFGRLFSLVGLSLPAFVSGILLLLAFAIQLRWFPVIGSSQPSSLADRFFGVALPALNLGIIMSAYVARVTRTSMLATLGEDYVRTARAKGVRSTRLILRHVLSNSLLPIITVVGLYFGTLIGNSVLTEIVFNRPGMGRLILGALNTRDYTLLQGLMIIFASFVVLANLLTDLAYAAVDPRIRTS
ncbi:ABC transporter permease [Aquamicrobium sp. LC103]|uniref:ABC transporter permease n=1 Tax=Aquamicrobium sp. LC103 TaxID=1120658 RepID=UPI00063EB32C|nr:ABC transporter permease [Aquamicrobium sp. LC103]TKT78294.1 ABC transporter permease [Aquamicrobium sp. LC103]